MAWPAGGAVARRVARERVVVVARLLLLLLRGEGGRTEWVTRVLQGRSRASGLHGRGATVALWSAGDNRCMKSALFVDFDNVYSGLRKLDPTSADRFARQPLRWVEWVLGDLPPPEHASPGARRRLLVRRVYLNPQVYQRYRPAFNHAGFEIIDCPAMTSEGKTSTDIHMVLDMVDLLQHEVHYDEFIVFSADADFTPVLRKLRRWDRRTTVLAVGFPSAAYRASADLLIDQDAFVREALGMGEDDEAGMPGGGAASGGPALPAGAAAAGGSEPTGATAPTAELIEATTQAAARLIHDEVARAERPVAVARLASLILREHPWLGPDWNGHLSFRRFLETLPLEGLVLDWRHSGGHVLDASRLSAEANEPPTERPMAAPDTPVGEGGWGMDAATLGVIRQVHNNTGVPLIPPASFRSLLTEVAADVALQPFQLNDTGKRVRDRCRDAGLDISRNEVNWVLRGLLLSGHEFGQGQDDVPTLSYKLVGNLINLCRREQMVMEEGHAALLHRWVSGRGGVD